MTTHGVAALLARGVIERVEPDTDAAREELAVARRHIDSAETLAQSDPTGAFSLGYDAIRKAISGHMRAGGYRARTGPGHHTRTGRYAAAALDAPGLGVHLQAFEDLRRLRNQSQYEGLEVETAEVQELLVHARAIVGAIGDDLGL